MEISALRRGVAWRGACRMLANGARMGNHGRMKRSVLPLVLALALRTIAEPTVVTVQPQQVRQEFQGMGCGAIFYEGHITSLAARGRTNEQERLYEDLFGRVRTDYLHLMIRPDHEPANDNADPFVPSFPDKDFAYCGHDLQIAAAARKRNPAMRLYAALYTPPGWMKTNGEPGGGGPRKGTLKPGLELELGEYCWAFLAYMHRHGQTVEFLSICNEPDWAHTQPGYYLTPEQHAQLFAKVAAYFDEMARRFPNVPKPKFVAPNVLSAVDCAERYLPATLAAAGSAVDVVGCHDYDRRGHRWAKLRTLAGPRPLWMTEWCVNGADKSPGLLRSASEFWLAMTEAFNDGANVWMAYDWVYPPREGGEALVHVDWGKAYTLTKIYHGFRQWCMPLEPGMRVVATEVSGPRASDISKPGVKASAFLAADGRKLVVQVAAVQDEAAEIELHVGAPFLEAMARSWRTSATEDAIELPSARLRNGRIVATLPARGLFSVVAE